MEHTVSEGTSFRAFHDARGVAFLPGIAVAAKTGTLTDAAAHRYYTWFTGFAPARPIPGVRQVAVGVLVVAEWMSEDLDEATWQKLFVDVTPEDLATKGKPFPIAPYFNDILESYERKVQ